MRPPNTTFDVYLSGRLPPADPDLTGARGHLRDQWREGSEANKVDRTFFWTAVLEASLGINIPDTYPGVPGNTTLWVPDQNGDAYLVVFVERERRSRGADFQRVYLVKGGTLMALTVQEVDGSPSYAGITTLLFDQDDGFVVSQPAANQARVDMQAASLTQVGIVSLSAQSLGAGAKYFSDKVGIGTNSPLANSALDVRGYTYAYFAGILAFGGGNTPSAESAGAILQYDGSAGNKNISLTIAAADYASGMVGGALVQGTNKRFVLRHKTASQPKYAFYNDDTSAYIDGVTGTGGGGDTFTGGLCTALRAGAGTGGFIGPPIRWLQAADMTYTTFAVSGTQYEFYSQPAAEHSDAFVVKIITPFTKTLPGAITLDLGTAGNPTAYLTGFDLTQAAGSFGTGLPTGMSNTLNSLTSSTSLKARVNYTSGSLTAGEFVVHLRAGQVM